MVERATSIGDLVRRAAAARPDHPAVVAGGRVDSWASLDAQVDVVAAAYAALGLRPGSAAQPGDRVALVLGNSPEFIAAYVGAARAGLVAVPLNPTLTAHELTRALADSGARLVIRSEAVAPTVTAAAAELSRVRLMSYDALVAGARGDAAVPAAPVDPESLALLLYTSGTLGQPKGAMLTHRALMANVEQVAALPEPPFGPDDRVLLVLPLFHIFGLNGCLAQVARQAGTLVLGDRFDPIATLDIIGAQQVTHLPVVPPMLSAWLRVPADRLRPGFAGVRSVLSGAAPLPREVNEAFTAATGVVVHEGYGLTEAAPGVTLTNVGGEPKPGSIGRPLPGVEIRLRDAIEADEEDPEEGLASPTGSSDDGPGEMLIRGENLFSGYWPDGAGGPDADGWFATGDVAYADDAGDYRIVDRARELIIVNGFNVYPREIELVLAAAPGVAEAAVIGIPDEATGEAVKGFITAMPGAEIDLDAVREHCEEWLARFKQPRELVVVDRLPHSPTGKVAKRLLRAD